VSPTPEWLRIRRGKDAEARDAALWSKCPDCGEVLYRRDLAANLYVCTKCRHHFRMGAYDRISAIVDGDERRLRELARNLLENGVRHARASVRIASQRNGRTCDVVVEDDGEGVPPDDRERVFERFYRRRDDGVGTGLGLAIVRWIAHAHGGNVALTQAAQGGARFVATFPAHDPA